MVNHNNTSPVSCFLFSGEVGGTGYGLPCVWWADDSHPGAASLWFPPGSASGCVEPRLLVSHRALRDGDGASWCQGLCLFPHHNGAKSLPHWTVLLHDVCCWENVQTGELWNRVLRIIFSLSVSFHVCSKVGRTKNLFNPLNLTVELCVKQSSFLQSRNLIHTYRFILIYNPDYKKVGTLCKT